MKTKMKTKTLLGIVNMPYDADYARKGKREASEQGITFNTWMERGYLPMPKERQS